MFKGFQISSSLIVYSFPSTTVDSVYLRNMAPPGSRLGFSQKWVMASSGISATSAGILLSSNPATPVGSGQPTLSTGCTSESLTTGGLSATGARQGTVTVSGCKGFWWDTVAGCCCWRTVIGGMEIILDGGWTEGCCIIGFTGAILTEASNISATGMVVKSGSCHASGLPHIRSSPVLISGSKLFWTCSLCAATGMGCTTFSCLITRYF